MTSSDARTTREPLTKEPGDASLRDILKRLDEETGRIDGIVDRKGQFI